MKFVPLDAPLQNMSPTKLLPIPMTLRSLWSADAALFRRQVVSVTPRIYVEFNFDTTDDETDAVCVNSLIRTSSASKASPAGLFSDPESKLNNNLSVFTLNSSCFFLDPWYFWWLDLDWISFFWPRRLPCLSSASYVFFWISNRNTHTDSLDNSLCAPRFTARSRRPDSNEHYYERNIRYKPRQRTHTQRFRLRRKIMLAWKINLLKCSQTSFQRSDFLIFKNATTWTSFLVLKLFPLVWDYWLLSVITCHQTKWLCKEQMRFKQTSATPQASSKLPKRNSSWGHPEDSVDFDISQRMTLHDVQRYLCVPLWTLPSDKELHVKVPAAHPQNFLRKDLVLKKSKNCLALEKILCCGFVPWYRFVLTSTASYSATLIHASATKIPS